MPHETLIVERDGPVTKVTLNRPDVRNALSPQMLAELRRPSRRRATTTTCAFWC